MNTFTDYIACAEHLIGEGYTTKGNIVAAGGIQQSSMLMIIVGVLIFFFGLLADQIAHIRRELSRK